VASEHHEDAVMARGRLAVAVLSWTTWAWLIQSGRIGSPILSGQRFSIRELPQGIAGHELGPLRSILARWWSTQAFR
jgi:hypothetical protein